MLRPWYVVELDFLLNHIYALHLLSFGKEQNGGEGCIIPVTQEKRN